ncbi:PLAT/LH2 domain-containing protein [Fibrobacter sp. UWB11]|uniref:PLAT/LH2 domain-containing protein n=1 Tax=Fibrobacter sp. UWB11 TaxID=1896202 RepID=UPI0009264BAE|nr:PLAT/LH2 domain-containing protein [Fibrobacter sp. UWB11]SIN96167.1 PLAT/LH2 domain-containing protein [Fibrobacter sp. UWB11]
MTTYTIRIVTGTKRGAGTNANVFVKAVGSKASKTWKNLKDPNDFDAFESGDVNIIKVTSSTDLGDIKKAEIGHDDSGLGSGWYLKNFQITNDNTGKKWFFEVNRWLASDEGDKKIKVTLTPTSVISPTPSDPNSKENLLKKINDWNSSRTNCAWPGIPKKNVKAGLEKIVELYFGETEEYTVFRDCGGSNKKNYKTGIDQGNGFSICGPVAVMFYLAKLNMVRLIDIVTTLYEYGYLLTYHVSESLRTLKDNDKIGTLYKCNFKEVADVCWMIQSSLADKEAVGSVDFDSSFLTLHTRLEELVDDVEFIFNAKKIKKQSSWSIVRDANKNFEEWMKYLKDGGAVFWCMHSTALKNEIDGKNNDYGHLELSDLHWVVVLGAKKFTNGVHISLHSWGKLYKISVTVAQFQKMSYDALLFKAS